MHRAAFQGGKLIYTKSKDQKKGIPLGWITLRECKKQMVAIETEYPKSKDLFRHLLIPGSNRITFLVASAGVIDRSSTLEDISTIFKEISRELQAFSATQSAQYLHPLIKRSIFPITRHAEGCTYDILSTIGDSRWFIADRPHLRKSYHKKVPLLSFSVEDLSAMDELLRTFRLDNRKLSSLVQITTSPRGLISPQPQYSFHLQSKARFIKA